MIVQFPEPKGPVEAYFVAIVIREDPESGAKDWCRYITLELSAERSNATVLAEWRDGGHFNYGSGPPADPKAFKQAVISHIEGR